MLVFTKPPNFSKSLNSASPLSLIFSSFVGFLLLVLLIALTHTAFFFQQQTQKLATGLSKNLYGIAAGYVMTGLSTTNLNRYMDDYKALGAQWIRLDFDWTGIQPNNASTYNWAAYDAVVKAANLRGIRVLGTLDSSPKWAVSSTCTRKDFYVCPPKSNADYAAFAAAVAAHYAPMGVHNWELWNEPNNDGMFTAASYTALLKTAYPAIKSADPLAFVLAGGSGQDVSPVDFLIGMYQNGAKGYFDALAQHPYCFSINFDCPKTYAKWSLWSEMQDTNPSLRSVMTANGDQNKKIWATEFGAPTAGSAYAVSEAQQAQMLIDAYTLFGSYSWSGPLFWYTYKDLCTDTTNPECYFGLVRTDFSHKPAYDAYKNLAGNAILPNTH